MVSDVMHDETCRVLADVLRERGEGFIQMTMVSGNPKRDAEFFEELATRSGRPVLVTTSVDEVCRAVRSWLEALQALDADATVTARRRPGDRL